MKSDSFIFNLEETERIFDTNKEELPAWGFLEKLAFKILLTNAKKISPFKKYLYKFLGFPSSVTFSKNSEIKSGLLEIGEGVSLNNTKIVNYSTVFIGDNVGFSFDNILITSTHDFADFSKVKSKPIVIEDNVWITSRVIILGGIRIGKNSIIGAGSVVTKSIPPNVFAAGNPCKVIKQLDRNF